jgi:serine/threonine protein phosphatase 1
MPLLALPIAPIKLIIKLCNLALIMRTLVIGDIHGCYKELVQLLAKAQLTETDWVIALGDIVDRGPDSVKVYDFLKNRPNTIVVMGNHEHKHLRQNLSYSQEIVKLQFGDRYPEFLAWARHLPYYYETADAIFAHAAVANGLPLKEQRKDVLCGCTAAEKYLEKQYGKLYWGYDYTGKKPVIVGHHRVGDEPLIINQKVYGIDTGACHGSRLTGLILPNFEIVQVQSPQDYWREEIEKWQLPVLMAKPWGSYQWAKIKALCEEYQQSANQALKAFMVEQEQWMQDLLALAPTAILKIETKLAELIALHGADGFKQQVHGLPYAPLLYQANSSSLTPEMLQQTLPTPEQWLKVMTELEVLP